MPRPFTRSLLGSLVCFTAMGFAQEMNLSPQPTPSCEKKCSRAAIRHIEGGGRGCHQGYTTLEGFFAPAYDLSTWMPFLDIRAHLFNDTNLATNAGIGFRKIIKKRIYGFNLYHDYRTTKKIAYNQLGIGLESLGESWDFRINGYLPVKKKITSAYDVTFSGFSGHYLMLSQTHEFAMRGADAEIGFHFAPSSVFDLYAGAGPYYYTGQIGSPLLGIKGRLACRFNEYATLELSHSYDRMFENKFQCEITLSFPLENQSRNPQKNTSSSSQTSNILLLRMMEPVYREEVIVVGEGKTDVPAIDPSTGEPFYFVFVNNTSHSLGTYESPYPTLALAEENSNIGDIIYVFPGDETTTGMDKGIFLKANQKFWGSGIAHSIQTSKGTTSIPAQSHTSPTITNTDIDTDGNAITLANNNVISGFNITSSYNDAIYGADLQSLEVSSCTITHTNTYAIETSCSDNASITVTNNQFLNNVNGIALTLNGASTVTCSNNVFSGQSSVSSSPIDISATSHTLDTTIKNNVFNDNTTGGIRFHLNHLEDVNISVLNNTITNSDTGSQASLGSSLVVITDGTTDHCSIDLTGNTFSGNTSNALYLHTSGLITHLDATVSENTMSDNGGSGLVFATPVDTLTLVATDNTIQGSLDNGISVIAAGSSSTGDITLSNNTITDIGNTSNGIAVNQNFSTLNLAILNNEIDNCEGTGIISYAPNGIDNLILTVSGNTISHCENLSSNATGGLDIEQYTNLEGIITDNSFSNNTGYGVFMSSEASTPSVTLELSGNDSDTDYYFSNNSGTFTLSPHDVESVNTGTIQTSGIIDIVP